jgi:hypothetical protein
MSCIVDSLCLMSCYPVTERSSCKASAMRRCAQLASLRDRRGGTTEARFARAAIAARTAKLTSVAAVATGDQHRHRPGRPMVDRGRKLNGRR